MSTSNNQSNKRRKTSPLRGPDGLVQMTVLPNAILTEVASYLSKPSRAIFSVAIMAQKQPLSSSASMAILYNSSRTQLQDQEEWGVLDFSELESDTAEKLTDCDLAAILASINAIDNLKVLKLCGCNSIDGRGLELLCGSTILEKIDLTDVHINGSKTFVVPILNSIITVPGNSLKHIKPPGMWGWSMFFKLVNRSRQSLYGRCLGGTEECDTILRTARSKKCRRCSFLICQDCVEDLRNPNDIMCHTCEMWP